MYFRLGDYENAIVRYEKNLEVKVCCSGIGHLDVVGTLGNIANVQQAQGKFPEALEIFQKVLDIFQLALGPLHSSSAANQNNIG